MRTARSVVALCLIAAGCSSPFAHLPVAPPSAYVGAEAALRKGDFAAAERGFEAYLESSPDETYRTRAYYRLAQARFGAQRYRDALRSLDDLQNEFPEQQGPQIPALAGDAHYALGQRVEAILRWEQAWARASESDRELLRPRLEKAIDELDASDTEQLAGLLSVPEVHAMLESHTPEPAPAVAAVPATPRAVAPEKELEPAAAPPPGPVSAGIGEVWSDGAGKRAPDAQAAKRLSNAQVEAGIGRPYFPATLESDDGEQLAVGCLLPLTGTDRAAGRRALNGLRLAFEGSLYALAVQDTGSDPAIAELLIHKLAADTSVLAAIGPQGEADADAVAPLADQLGMPLLLLSEKEGFAGRFVLQAATTRRQQVRAIVRYATQTLVLSRLGVLYPEDEEGRAFLNAFSNEVRIQGGTLVGSRGYGPGQSSFGGEAGAARTWSQKNGVQAIFVPDDAETAVLVAAALRRVVPDVVLLGSERWHDVPVLARAGDAVEGAVFAGSFHPSSKAAGAQSFASEFRQRAGDFPSALEAQAYDAGMLVRRVLEGGADTREEVLSSLRAVGSYDGAGRIIAAPEKFEREPVLLRVRKGEIEEVPG